AGRIDSKVALQYPGNPAMTLTFAKPVAECLFLSGKKCVNAVTALGSSASATSVEVRLGGRYLAASATDDCKASGEGFELTTFPWTVPGSLPPGVTEPGPYFYECRDGKLPFMGASADDAKARNLSMGGANPLPDGRPRERRIELVDGVMIDSEQMYLLVKESFGLRIDAATEKSFPAYGLVILKRNRVTLTDADFAGSDFSKDTRTYPTTDLLSPRCDPALLAKIGANPSYDVIAETLIKGVSSTTTAPVVYPPSEDLNNDKFVSPTEKIPNYPKPWVTPEWAPHYFCEETGHVDGGAKDDGTATASDDDSCATSKNSSCEDGGSGSAASTCAKGTDKTDCGLRFSLPNDDSCPVDPDTGKARTANQVCDDGGIGSSGSGCALGTDVTDCGTRRKADPRETCPAASRVVYFLAKADILPQAQIASWSCQGAGKSCWTALKALETGDLVILDPVWTCHNSTYSYCSSNLLDLREGKVFYGPAPAQGASFAPLLSEIEAGFRYKIQFRSRTGKTIGFAPSLCDEASDQIPYCYSPPKIEQVRQRVDCLLDL
ncbi:MAG TPA: hypothetical protein VGK17_25245, partial [Propionicimonas sp.]